MDLHPKTKKQWKAISIEDRLYVVVWLENGEHIATVNDNAKKSFSI